MKGKDSIGIKIQAALESKLCSKHCTLFFTQGMAHSDNLYLQLWVFTV